MKNSKTTDYELIVLGNDPQVVAFLRQAGREFSRVLWIRDAAESAVTMSETLAELQLQFRDLPWIEILEGGHEFVSDSTVRCELASAEVQLFTAERFVLAYGARPDRPNWMIAHPRVILHHGQASSADLAKFSATETVAIVGMGDRGQACLRQLRGQVRHVHCLDSREIAASPLLWKSAGGKSLTFHARTSVIGMRVELPEACEQAGGLASDSADHTGGVTLFLENGTTLSVSAVVVCCGTRGNTEQRGLENVSLTTDDRGKLWCNETGETWTPGIYALGEAVGYSCSNPTHSPTEYHRQLLHALSAQETGVFTY